VEQSYVRHGAKIEKKILLLHKNKHKGASEGDAKAAYIKLAQNLETFGTTFFLVKVQNLYNVIMNFIVFIFFHYGNG
jgi:hypothetical protein